jgi:hypothetical protein
VPASCRNCGARLPEESRFCPECGVRAAAANDVTAVEQIPPEETGQVPVHLTAAAPRYFGITPPLAVFALGVSSLVLGIVVLVAGHVLAGALLLAGAGVFGALFVTASRRLPQTAVARLSARAFHGIRDRAGFAVETVSVQSTARMELFRLRREVSELVARRAEAARELGEAVYVGADDESERARTRMRELDDDLGAKEAEMTKVATQANDRIHRAQLQVQPTAVVEPPATPEPPQPVTVPDPDPAPPEPLIPPAPEPTTPEPELPPQSPG